MNEYGSEAKKPELYTAILDDLSGTSEWRENVREVRKRRLGSRPAIRKTPYRGAPNFVMRIIDDTVREKTDQEIAMLWNAPLLAHVVPLEEMDEQLRSLTEQAFDTYVRHIIKGRSRIEAGMDCKNEIGFSVFKLVRLYSEVLEKETPNFIWADPLDVIVPGSTRGVESCERITHVLRYTEREFKNRGKKNGWKQIDEVIELVKKDGDDEGDDDGGNLFHAAQSLVGVSTSKSSRFVVAWECYHYAEEEDVAWAQAQNDEGITDLEVGRRCLTILCPDAPDMPLAKHAWKAQDQTIPPDPEEYANAIANTPVGEEPPGPEQFAQEVPGKDLPWPFVYAPFENRSNYWYDTRGGGHLCIDEQIAATQLQNVKATLLDYYAQPLLKGGRAGKNTGNVNFEPGSILPDDVEFQTPPQIPQAINFEINQLQFTAARRMAAGSQYNFSTELGNRKVEKTATEVETEQSRLASVSSTSVDRFNEPLCELFQKLWNQLKKEELVFPLIQPGLGFSGQSGPDVYKTSILLVPAASAKTLNPEVQLLRSQQLITFCTQYMQQVPFDLQAALRHMLSHYDAVITDKWMFEPTEEGPDGQPPIYKMLEQIMQDIQGLAQGGQQMDKELEATQKLAIENSEKTDSNEEKIEDIVESREEEKHREAMARTPATSAN